MNSICTPGVRSSASNAQNTSHASSRSGSTRGFLLTALLAAFFGCSLAALLIVFSGASLVVLRDALPILLPGASLVFLVGGAAVAYPKPRQRVGHGVRPNHDADPMHR